MDNWFEISMSDPELRKAFYEKIYEKDDNTEYRMANKHVKARDNSWVKKRSYRKKMVRNFLSLKPSMKIEDLHPLYSKNAIYINNHISTDGGAYNINHVSHLYITPRGHLQKFRGVLEWGHDGVVFGVGCKDRNISRITNRRIQRMKSEIDMSMKYSYYKKTFAPIYIGIL